MKRKAIKTSRNQRSHSAVRRVVFLAFFLSGLAGLMHEVVWSKLLVPLIGATAYSQTAVLAVFMGGLALGAVLFGRRSDHGGNPLRTYVILEMVIGVYGLLLPFLLLITRQLYVGLASSFFESSGLSLMLRFSFAVMTILLPAVLMGGTLPILARYLINRIDQTQRRVASLYALNSFGAVLGAGFAGFFTLPLFGVYPSLVIASMLNIMAGILVYRLSKETPLTKDRNRSKPPQPKPIKQAASDPPLPYSTLQYLVTLVALVMSGFSAMGYEVLYLRIIALSFGSSTYSFTVMLMSFITGIAIGSTIVSFRKVENPLRLLMISQFGVVITLIAATPLVSRLPYIIGLLRIQLQDSPLGFEFYQFGKALLCLTFLSIPTTCLGFSFPLVAQVQARRPQKIGAYVGSTYAWNTVGNVYGVMVTSLLLLPWVGLLDGFHFNLGLNFIAGFILLLVIPEMKIKRRILCGVTTGVVVVLYLIFGTGWCDSIRFVKNHLRLRSGPSASLTAQALAAHPASSFKAWKKFFVADEDQLEYFFFDEDAHATVMVAGSHKNLQLFVNSKPDASSTHDLDVQMLLAHAPLFLTPEAHTLLVIGHGAGITAGSALRHPVKHVDIVEISRAVMNADFMFAHANYKVLGDARVRIYIDDGQSFLRVSPLNYDVIISQPSNPWISGIGGLFTVEFFESVRDKLNPGGRFGLWLQAYEQSDDMVELVFRTLGSVFPNVMLFGDKDLSNFFAVTSMDPIKPDFGQMELRFEEPAVRNDLARLEITNLAGFLSHHRISPKRFKVLCTPGPLNTVTHERLEYTAPRSMFKGEGSILIDRLDPLVQGVDKETDILLDQYIAYRASVNRPISIRELNAVAQYVKAAGGYGTEIAKSILLRSEKLNH